MAITCDRILDRVSNKLLDSGKVRWTGPQQLEDLNAALTWLAINKPASSVGYGGIPLVAGCRQSLEAPSAPAAQPFQLLSIDHNLGDDGETMGTPIRMIELNELNNLIPDWTTQTGEAIEFYAYDPRDPLSFYIYPSPDSLPMYVGGKWAQTPITITSDSAAFPVPDVYEEPIYLFVLGAALMKNSKSGDYAKGMNYMQMAAGLIGVKLQSAARTAPLDPDRAEATGADV